MKRLFTLLALSAMSLATFSACNETTVGDPSPIPTPPGPAPSELTPDEHKQKLESIAMQLVDEFNPADFNTLTESLASLASYLPSEEEDEWGDSEEVPEVTQALKSGSVSALTSAITRASEQFIIDANDGAIEVEGYRFTFDESGEPSYEELGRTGVVEVAWDNAVATFTWGENDGRYTYYFEEDDVEYIVEVPSYINASLKINEVEHLNINIEPKVIDNYTFAPKLTIKIYGGYEVVTEVNADSQKLNHNTLLNKNAKKLISATSEFYINGFTNPDNWLAEYEYGDGYVETGYDPEEYFNNNVTSAQFRYDVLTLSIIGSCSDIKKMLEEEEELLDDRDDDYTAYYTGLATIMNKYFNIIAVYNDTDEKIADIKWQGFYNEGYDEEYDCTVIAAGCEPILVFPDGSKFSLEQFFTMEDFEDLFEQISEKFGE